MILVYETAGREVYSMVDQIQVFTQNSIRIKTEAGVVYIDPFQMHAEPHDADFVLVTHDHFDHFSPEDIAKVCGPKTILIVPENMKDTARKAGDCVSEILTVIPGAAYEIDGLSFETVAAYNRLKPFHPAHAGWVGYILITEGKRIYIAGDTDAVSEVRAVRCDVALVPVGGTYTMDAKKAAELVNTLHPAVAIPTHYGSVVGSPNDGETFRQLVQPGIEVVLLKQY